MIGGIRHILLDIEGTTCPVSFVSEVLFPYAQRQVGDYLNRHAQDPAIQQLVRELQQAWQQEDHPEAVTLLQVARASRQESACQSGELDAAADGTDSLTEQALLPYLNWLIQNDRKLTAWKELQGLIWREGYARRELKANLFSDVLPTLRRWKQMGMELSVYSSGSVAAQQLLYGNSQEGDARPLFSHWFDTRIGAKQQTESYQRILELIGCRAEQVLFVSDALAELEAASTAGMRVAFSNREGNPHRDPGPFTSISSLDQLELG